MHTLRVADIRCELRNGWLVPGRGGDTVEVLGASFLADEETIFGKLNPDYVERELLWYASQSLKLSDFPGGAPPIWNSCAGVDGTVNSNYGWCIYSEANGLQFQNVVTELLRNPNSRRAIAIYNRPSMHLDSIEGGKQDFMCTNAVEYFIRRGKLDCVVQMRSNDAVLGYRNDRAWQQFMQLTIAGIVGVTPGSIYWQVGSLHVYERHFKLLEAL